MNGLNTRCNLKKNTLKLSLWLLIFTTSTYFKILSRVKFLKLLTMLCQRMLCQRVLTIPACLRKKCIFMGT